MVRRGLPASVVCGAMSRLGRYWLFFVIVAVGLALSWGQVGRKTQRALHEDPVSYLYTEPDCVATREPCAATAGDRALVLGPASGGLRLKFAGLEPAAIVSVEARLLSPADAEPLSRALLREADSWRLPLATGAHDRVRIRVSTRDGASVAEFRLD